MEMIPFPLSCVVVMMAKEKPPMTVVGDVGGRIAIIIVRRVVYILCLPNAITFFLIYIDSLRTFIVTLKSL